MPHTAGMETRHPCEHDYRPAVGPNPKVGPLMEECRHCGLYRPLPAPKYFKDMRRGS